MDNPGRQAAQLCTPPKLTHTCGLICALSLLHLISDCDEIFGRDKITFDHKSVLQMKNDNILKFVNAFSDLFILD